VAKVARKKSTTSKKSTRTAAGPKAAKRSAHFCEAAFGFSLDTLMAAPNSIGNMPATLYVLVDNVDDVFGNAVAAGGKVLMPVADMFWGDRCGMIADPDGNKWMLATHVSEPTEVEMAAAMQAPQE